MKLQSMVRTRKKKKTNKQMFLVGPARYFFFFFFCGGGGGGAPLLFLLFVIGNICTSKNQKVLFFTFNLYPVVLNCMSPKKTLNVKEMAFVCVLIRTLKF